MVDGPFFHHQRKMHGRSENDAICCPLSPSARRIFEECLVNFIVIAKSGGPLGIFVFRCQELSRGMTSQVVTR